MIERPVPTVSADLVASIAAKVAARRVSSPETQPAAAFQRRPYHEAAAVLAAYEPHSLVPVGAEPPNAPLTQVLNRDEAPQAAVAPLDALLADSVQIARRGDAQIWSLKPGVRVAVLRQLREEDRIGQALRQNAGKPDDPVDRMLRVFLTGPSPALASLTREELAAARVVSDWLREAGFQGLPTRDEILGRFEWKALLDPFEHLATQFGGRQSELATLREYADVLPPQRVLGALLTAARRAFNFTQKPPLMIYGPGGVGKSTLVSRFILEHAQAHEVDRFPFVYLDYDRAEVAFDQPITLLIEAVRQLGVQYPAARVQCEALRRGWLTDFSPRQTGTPISPAQQPLPLSPSGLAHLVERATRDFVSLLGSLGVSDRPVLFVLDTFEEVQRRSEEYVDAVWRLVEDLRSQIARLRVVIVGRSDIPRRHTQAMALKGLDQEAAVAYLMGRGIPDHATATRLANQLGGSPLSLKLAVEMFTHAGFDASSGLDITTREYFFLRVDDALIQRQLYTRILSYVQDEEVRRLAHPGLVLRQLTPELILEVLKGPCGLDSIETLEQARNLFQRLRKEVALVSEIDDNTVKHRSDLRLLMVPLVRAAEPAKSQEIDEKAVEYYSRSPSRVGRAEEIYHRLWLDQPLNTISSRWMAGVEASLAGAVEEFSGARKAYLASRLGVDVDAETRRLAELEDWERLTGRKAADLLQAVDADGALKLLHIRPERSASSPLPLLEARALVMLEQGDEALAVLDEGIGRAIEAGHRQQALILVTQAARVVIRCGLAEVAGRYRARLAGFHQPSAGPIERLSVAVPAWAMAALEVPATPDVTAALEKDVLDAFDALSDEALIKEPELVMWSATMMRDPARLARVLRIVTIRPVRASDVRRLSGELARFDVSLSETTGGKPGALRQRFNLVSRESVTETWSDFLANAAPDVMQKAVAEILVEYGDRVPESVIDCVRRLPRFALGFEEDTAAHQAPTEQASTGRTTAGDQLRALQQAFVEAFPSRADLEQLLFYRMDRRLDALASPNLPLPAAVFEVLAAADAGGWLQQLVAAARQARPNNPTLQAAAKNLGVSTVESDLESIVRGAQPSLDIVQFRERLGRLEGQVCRVDVAGTPVSTGFLVGSDLVLTADFALTDVIEGRVPSSEVACRFDYKTGSDQRVVSQGTVFGLESNWLVARDPWMDESHGLGYVLLRVQNSPGLLPIGGATFEAVAVLRRWIDLPSSPGAPQAGEGLFILQHPLGRPLTLAMEAGKGVAGVSSDGTRLFHTVNTEPGSSGSPCFSTGLEVVAMHIGVSEKGNTKVAVPIAAISEDLRRKGVGRFERFA